MLRDDMVPVFVVQHACERRERLYTKLSEVKDEIGAQLRAAVDMEVDGPTTLVSVRWMSRKEVAEREQATR